MNILVLQEEVQEFLHRHISYDVRELALQKSPFSGITSSELASQLKGMQIAKLKFPSLLQQPFYYPPSIALEQASSEATARYKSDLLAGHSMVDLTGGMGIDFIFLSQKFEKADFIESQPNLLEISSYNIPLFSSTTQLNFHETTAEKFSTHISQPYSLIYLDPSRRKNNQKKFLIEDLSPDLNQLYPEIKNKFQTLMVKISPMYDISEAIRKFPSLSEIHLVEWEDELKEMLLIFSEKEDSNPFSIVAAHAQNKEKNYRFNYPYTPSTIEYSEVLPYLYIPSPAILKSGFSDHYAERLSLKKLHPNTQIYTSDKLESTYMGRIFKVTDFQPNLKLLKNSSLNIISKNYPLRAPEIAQKYALKEGGIDYLIFGRSLQNTFGIRAEKVQ